MLGVKMLRKNLTNDKRKNVLFNFQLIEPHAKKKYYNEILCTEDSKNGVS